MGSTGNLNESSEKKLLFLPPWRISGSSSKEAETAASPSVFRILGHTEEGCRRVIISHDDVVNIWTLEIHFSLK